MQSKPSFNLAQVNAAENDWMKFSVSWSVCLTFLLTISPRAAQRL